MVCYKCGFSLFSESRFITERSRNVASLTAWHRGEHWGNVLETSCSVCRVQKHVGLVVRLCFFSLTLAFYLTLALSLDVPRTFRNRMTPRGTLGECCRNFRWCMLCSETRGVVWTTLAFSEKHITWKKQLVGCDRNGLYTLRTWISSNGSWQTHLHKCHVTRRSVGPDTWEKRCNN